MVIKSQKTFVRVELNPSVTFIAGHPHREVFKADEDGLKKFKG